MMLASTDGQRINGWVGLIICGVTQRRSFPSGLIAILLAGVLIGGGLAFLVLSTNSATKTNGGILAVPTSSRILREGQPSPKWTLKTLDGKPVSLTDVKGKAVLINFWASWCPPCIEETPALIAAYTELKSEGRAVEFIGVSTNDPDKDALRKFAANNKIPYLVVDDADDKVGEAYGVLGMPTTVVVDGNGVVRRVITGPVTKEQVLGMMRGTK